MRYTYPQVRASYGGAKAEQERHDIMFRFFARPLSFPVAWLALNVGLTPNQVTYLSLILNLLGLGLMASGRRLLMGWGVMIILLALVLDAADGNMARTARRFSPLGEWLEGLGAYILSAGFHVAGGTGAWVAMIRGDAVSSWPVDPKFGGILVALGAVAGATMSITILSAAKFQVVFPTVDRNKVVARMGGGVYGLFFTVGRNLSFASGLVLPMALVAVLSRHYEVVLALFAALNTAALLTLILRCTMLGLDTMRRGAQPL